MWDGEMMGRSDRGRRGELFHAAGALCSFCVWEGD